MEAGSAGGRPPELAIGEEFAEHRIEAVLGRGGMGIVYRARNLALDRDRALKVLAPALSADPRFRERFRRESRLAASLEHPNVLPVHDAGERDGLLYLAMRLVEGIDLRQLVQAAGPLEPRRAAAVVAGVAAALDAAHARGLVHRDVKPANVLVEDAEDGERIFLTDFGITRTAHGGETLTATGEIIGSADFIAPEQVAGEPVDARADVYALGGVAHYALTGEPPFPRENELATLFAHGHAARPRPSALRPGLSAAVDAALAHAMAVDPADRPVSAGQFAAELAAALQGTQLEQATRRMSASRRLSRRVWLAITASGVAAVAILATLVIGGDDDESGSPRPLPGPRPGPPITVGEQPTGITVGQLRVWVAVQGSSQVVGINPGTGAASPRLDVPGAKAVAAELGSIWAISDETDALYRLDPAEGRAQEFQLGPGTDPSDIAVDDRWVWIALEGTNEVARFDPQVPGGEVRTEQVGSSPRAIATGAGAVWVTNIDGDTVSEIDPLDVERIGSAIPVPGRPSDIAVGEGSVWVVSNLNGTLTRISPGTSPDDASHVAGDPIGGLVKPRGVKTGFGYVWVANGGDSTLARIDPDSGELAGEPVPVGADPADVAVGEDAVWTANSAAGSVTRVDPG